MMRKIAFLVACLSIVGLAGTAAAQVPATFVLKSGERVSGDLVDMGGSDYTISVSGQQRKFALDEPAVIDFTGGGQNFPANETSKLLPGQNLLVLRDGRMFAGRMYDVGGTHPLRITFQIDGQNRDFTSDQVARIYISAPTGTAATTGSGSQSATDQPGAIHVTANRAWTPTGITVQKGQILTFSSSGQVQLSADANDTAPVTGRAGRQASARASLPGVLAGALIGRIGNGRPFGIGNQNSITAPATGPLYLGVNDDVFTDNSGEFVVSVTGGTTTGAIRRR